MRKSGMAGGGDRGEVVANVELAVLGTSRHNTAVAVEKIGSAGNESDWERVVAAHKRDLERQAVKS